MIAFLSELDAILHWACSKAYGDDILDLPGAVWSCVDWNYLLFVLTKIILPNETFAIFMILSIHIRSNNHLLEYHLISNQEWMLLRTLFLIYHVGHFMMWALPLTHIVLRMESTHKIDNYKFRLARKKIRVVVMTAILRCLIS